MPSGKSSSLRHRANVVPLNRAQHDDDPQLFRQRIDRAPELLRSLARQREVLGRRDVGHLDVLLARGPAPIRAPSVDRQAPGHPDEPGLETVAIPELGEAPVGLCERLLRDVLGILAVPQHAIGDAERKGCRLPQPILELSFEILVQRHESPGIPAGPLIHSGSSSKTVWIGNGFSSAARSQKPGANSQTCTCHQSSDTLNCPVGRHILYVMAIKDAMLPEFDHEMGTTRRLLERTPEAEFAWKPHEKSFSLGQLAGHIANIPHWVDAILQHTVFDVESAGDTRPKAPPTIADLVAQFDKNVAAARAGIAATGDSEMMAPWTFKSGGQVVFTLPRAAALRSFVLNHLIHHRGQLSVYLRLKNVPLPSDLRPHRRRTVGGRRDKG